MRKDVSKKFGALIAPPKEGISIAQPGRQTNPDRAITPRGLTGLVNLGNTCYMNAALQCLSNVPALSDFFLACPTTVEKAEKNTLSKQYKNLLEDMWMRQNSRKAYTSPSGVLYAFKNVFPMFRGFQQHDSQEFLRCFMDILHEELMEPIPAPELNMDQDMDSVSDVGSNMGSSDAEPEEYETADSGVSERSSLADNEDVENLVVSRKRKLSAEGCNTGAMFASNGADSSGDGHALCKREREASNISSGDAGIGSLESQSITGASDIDLEFVDAASDVPTVSPSASMSSSPRSISKIGARPNRYCNEVYFYHASALG